MVTQSDCRGGGNMVTQSDCRGGGEGESQWATDIMGRIMVKGEQREVCRLPPPPSSKYPGAAPEFHIMSFSERPTGNDMRDSGAAPGVCLGGGGEMPRNCRRQLRKSCTGGGGGGGGGGEDSDTFPPPPPTSKIPPKCTYGVGVLSSGT